MKQLISGTAPTDLKRTARGLDVTSVNRIVSIVFGDVLRYAVTRRWIPVNPLQQVELPHREDAVRAILEPVELEALAMEAEHYGTISDKLMVQVMGYCGPRIGETIALRVGCFGKDQARLLITKTVTMNREDQPVEGLTKGWENRDALAPKFLLDPLTALCVGRGEEAHLFSSLHGDRINAHNWRARIWNNAVKGSGLDDVVGLTPHALRHTCASLAIKGGIDVKTLQVMLGHKNLLITPNTYSHLWPERLDNVAAIMEKAREDATA